MEQHPRDPEDRNRNTPEPERLSPGEIDLTGCVEQEDDLRDVIGDALVESQAADGELPEWGARTLARALANRRDDPISGALHQFAVTGRVDKDTILRELGELHTRATDEETAEWTLLLGVYIRDLPDAASGHQEEPELNKADVREGPATRFTEYLQRTAAQAREVGEAISHDDARLTAQMLAGFLVIMGIKDPAMIRLAETGEVDQPKLTDECQQLKAISWKLPDVHVWVGHLEQYLARHHGDDRPAKVPAPAELSSDNPQVAQGIHEHGDAFHAFLSLPDVAAERPDLLTHFREVYVGAYESMDEFAKDFTDIQACKARVDQVAASWGYDGFFVIDQELLDALVRATWDIVNYRGKLYVFSK